MYVMPVMEREVVQGAQGVALSHRVERPHDSLHSSSLAEKHVR